MSEAIGVLLTFTTYGTHLHGADTSSVSRNHRNWGSPAVPSNPAWQDQARRLMAEPEFTLVPQDRTLVLNSVIDACAYRAWHLFCVHIRTNHVHAILQTDVPVDRALSYLKGRASFVLKTNHPDRRRFWTKHGSTRYLWNPTSLAAARLCDERARNSYGVVDVPIESLTLQSLHSWLWCSVSERALVPDHILRLRGGYIFSLRN